MKTSDTIDLIRGTFTPRDAKEILLALLKSKSDFHNLKNLSSQERFGKPDADSEQRLRYLKEAREKVATIIAKSIDEGKNLTIKSSIDIKFE